VIKLIESLRSGVSKNALITLSEASNVFKRELDPELEAGIQKLIKKSIDSNSFISDEVRKLMVQLLSNCNESKSVNLLVSVY
jgi:hypothetical protein